MDLGNKAKVSTCTCDAHPPFKCMQVRTRAQDEQYYTANSKQYLVPGIDYVYQYIVHGTRYMLGPFLSKDFLSKFPDLFFAFFFVFYRRIFNLNFQFFFRAFFVFPYFPFFFPTI